MRNVFCSLKKYLQHPRSFSTSRSLAFKPYSREEEYTFYNYTSGTWLYNREAQRNIRRFKFNVDALITQCVKAVNATACTTFKKLAEGTSNRLFHARLDNGKDVVARLPFPIAGPTRLTTASEVATLEFARLRLNTPTPRVLSYYCIDAAATDVGSEFIIMEKVPGVDLYPRWNDDIPSDEFGGLIRDLVKTERRWVNASLSGIGSLYFARDLPPTILSLGLPGDVPCHEQWGRFVIGPSVVRKFWKGGRSQLSVDRGPWNELRSEISAAIRCGIEWLRHFARPYPRHSPLYRNERDNSPATHIDVLQRCLHIIPYLPDPPEYSTFCVWHPDLNPSNIVVDETGPLIPRCYLDWQTATVNALLDISVPSFLRYGGGKYVEAEPGSSSMPELPAEFNQLPETEQTIAKKEQRLAARSNYYHFVTEQWNPALHAAQFSRWQGWFHILLEYPQHTWEDGVAPLKQALIDMCKAWDDVAPGTTCPISFDPAEIRINEIDFLGWAREQAVQLLREKIGLGPDGWVKENELKDAKRRNREALEQTVAELDHEEDKAYIRRRWPFQDGAISSTAETCR